jgi:NADH-quinone oxidoreductase subunit L
MFLGVGVGAFTAGFFHVLTHAFFKACLFLGAGSVIHAMHARIHDTEASQDVNNMGGLKKYLPITHATFLASVLAIAGMPFLSGFFSKDEILYSAFTHSVVSERPGAFAWPAGTGAVLFAIGVTAAVMTAFYMFRLYFLTFHGSFKGWTIVPGWKDPHAGHGHDAHGHSAHGHSAHGHSAHGHDDHGHDAHDHHSGPIDGPEPHESPWPMTVPLIILGTLAVFGGLLNAPLLHITPLEHWLEPLFGSLVAEERLHNADPDHALMIPLLFPGIAAFLIGTGVAWFFYIKQEGAPARSLADRFPALHRLLVDKWRVDELYDELVVGSLEALADASVWFDKWVVDGIIARLTALLVTVWGHLLRLLQTGHAQAYAAMMVVGMFGIGWFVAVPQPKVVVSGDAATGQYSVQAAPGLGYSYRWDTNADGTFDSEEFGAASRVTVDLDEGASRDVRLEVKNAFGRTRQGVYQVSRPKRDGASAQLGHVPAGNGLLGGSSAQRAVGAVPSSIRGIQ